MRLFQLLDPARLGALPAGGFARGAGALHQMRKGCLYLTQDLVVIDRTGGGDDHALGTVMLAGKARQILAREMADPFGRTQDRAAHGLVGIGRLLQPVKDHVVGCVQRLADFLQDDAALDLDLARVENRVQHDIRQHVQRHRHIARQHPHVIAGHIARGIGVDVAADILDGLGNLQGRACRRALEGHMLKEMRDAVLVGAFVAATRVHPDADGGRMQAGHVAGDDAQTIRKRADAGLVQAVLRARIRDLS